MEFLLKIKLGNDAMQNESDVAQALREVARKVDRPAAQSGAIHDANGNTVGEWAFVFTRKGSRKRAPVRY